MIHSKVYIYGKHALTEALLATPEVVEKVFLSAQFEDAALRSLIKKHAIPNAVLNSQTMPREIDVSAVHQGIVGVVSLERLVVPFEKFVTNVARTSETALVILGGLSDPQNVGAAVRSAAAFGLSGVLIPEHNQAQITGSVVKVSAGMAFKIPLVSVSNVNTAVRELKDRGFAAYGLSGEAKQVITKEEFALPTLFILGNEAEGIREKTRELCDKLLSIPIHPHCESLNAAASAAVAFYAWSAKHPKALRGK